MLWGPFTKNREQGLGEVFGEFMIIRYSMGFGGRIQHRPRSAFNQCLLQAT